MDSRTAARAAWGGCAVAAGLFAVAAALLAAYPRPRPEAPIFFASYAIFTLYTAIGALIAARRPRNRFGWTLLVGGGLGAVTMAAEEYAARGLVAFPGSLPGAALAGWISEWLFFPHVVLTAVLPFFLFPSGRLPGPRWRLAVAVPVAAGSLLVLGHALVPRLDDFGVRNPLAVDALAAVAAAANRLGTVLLLVSFALGVAALVVRFRRSAGAERQQMKWFVYGTSVMGVAVFIAFLVPVLTGAPAPVALQLLLVSSLLAIPVTSAVAILRYRLYDIDVVISRTLAYGALAVLVTALYVAVVAVLGAVLGGGSRPSLVRSVAATAAVALAFQPLRERLERLANRLVYGERATPYETLSSFSSRMAAAVSVDDTLPQIAEAAGRGVGALRARVSLRLGSDEHVTVWPPGALGQVDHVVPVTYGGEPIGEIAVAKSPGDPLRPAEAVLLRDLASQAALVLRNVRLTMELQQRLEQLSRSAELLQQSRARLVQAQDLERRRLERDLHDGAQQSLVSLSGQLRRLGGLLSGDPHRASALARDLLGEADAALEQIRDLARGIFPKILADRGLVAALRAHLAKHVPDAELLFDAAAEHLRADPETESAAYFCCLEALQNAAKHARGAPVVVSVRVEERMLLVAVADSGPGFDPSAAGDGMGLLGIRDRIGALGGRVTIDATPGRGAVVSAALPLHPVPVGVAP